MKVLIIEDEQIAADRLEKIIKAIDPTIEISGKIETVRKSVDWLESKGKPDLIFLDIQLADGLSFEIFKQTPVDVPVIFTTSYDQYTLKAFQLNSIDYLLKPIQESDVRKSIAKYLKVKDQYSTGNTLDERILSKIYQAFNKSHYKERFIVKIGEHIKSVLTGDIMYFESREKATFIKTSDHKSFIVDSTLDQLSEQLNPVDFFRINRKFIISLHSFDDIVSWSNSRLRVCLKNNNTMDAVVAREKVNDFKNWLDGNLNL